MPDFFLALRIAPGAHLIVNAFGSAAQRQFTQGNQIAFAEEIFDRSLGLPRQIDFAFIQTLAQIVRGKVNQHHFISRIKKGIGDSFAHLNSGDAADHVVQAFQMLDVNGSKDIDARLKQFINILPAFGVTGAGRIAVRQLIHQHQRWATGEGGVEIKLHHVAPTIGGALRRQRTESLEHGRRFFAPVSFHYAREDI